MHTPPCPPGEETPYTMLIRQDWDRWYPEYLRSPAWEATREEVLERSDGKCERCQAQATDVHHKNYGTVGNEDPADLQALCRRCHKNQHRRTDDI